MAKPLSALTLSALALPTQDLTAVQIYNLSVQGLIEPEGDLLVHSDGKTSRTRDRKGPGVWCTEGAWQGFGNDVPAG